MRSPTFAKCVIDNIPKEKYEIILIGIDKAGRWFLTDSNTDDIASGAWEQNPRNRVAFLSPDRSVGGLVALDGGHACEIIKVDVVFPVLHGKNGEDGTIQGLFQMARHPLWSAAARWPPPSAWIRRSPAPC